MPLLLRALAVSFSLCCLTASVASAKVSGEDDFLRPISSTEGETLPSPDAVVDQELRGGGSADGLYICCAAGYCTYAAIEDCSLLSPTGKIVALSVAGVAAISGFVVGFFGGAVLFAGQDILDPTSGYDAEAQADALLTLGFLGGATGFVVGGALGMLTGFVIDPLCWPASSWRPTTPRSPGGSTAPPRMRTTRTPTPFASLPTATTPTAPLMAWYE